jgi:hypothetical protein
MATFEPHGGTNLSTCLFPVSQITAALFFPHSSFPVVLWYSLAVGQWITFGMFVDLLRAARRTSGRSTS